MCILVHRMGLEAGHPVHMKDPCRVHSKSRLLKAATEEAYTLQVNKQTRAVGAY